MNIDKLHSLKDRICDELEEMSEQGLNMSNLEAIDKLSRTAKNVDKLIKCEESKGYSMDGDWTASGSYSRGRGRYSMSDRYPMDERYSMEDRMNSYGHDDYSENGHAYENRDYRGRYSREDSREKIMESLRTMRENAKDQSERQAITKVINQMNSVR